GGTPDGTGGRRGPEAAAAASGPEAGFDGGPSGLGGAARCGPAGQRAARFAARPALRRGQAGAQAGRPGGLLSHRLLAAFVLLGRGRAAAGLAGANAGAHQGGAGCGAAVAARGWVGTGGVWRRDGVSTGK